MWQSVMRMMLSLSALRWVCSENEQPIAKALQRIMVNKAERHLDVPLRDLLLKEDEPQPKGGTARDMEEGESGE